MKIAIGSDHGGYELKEQIKAYLGKKSVEIVDFGTDSTEAVDYPDYGKFRKGYIALQDHDSPIWFRNIKIRKL